VSNNYDLEICKFCKCTDYGLEPVNNGHWNLCEGYGCKEAIESYEEDTGEKWEG